MACKETGCFERRQFENGRFTADMLLFNWDITDEDYHLIKSIGSLRLPLNSNVKAYLQKVTAEIGTDRRYTKFIRSLTNGMWRQFLVLLRHGLKIETLTTCEYQLIIDHFLADIYVASPQNWPSFFALEMMDPELLENLDIDLNGWSLKLNAKKDLWKRKVAQSPPPFKLKMDAVECPLRFNCYQHCYHWLKNVTDVGLDVLSITLEHEDKILEKRQNLVQKLRNTVQPHFDASNCLTLRNLIKLMGNQQQRYELFRQEFFYPSVSHTMDMGYDPTEEDKFAKITNAYHHLLKFRSEDDTLRRSNILPKAT